MPRRPSWQDSILHVYPDARLDLHGKRAVEAERAVDSFLEAQARLGKGRVVHLITGKGTGVLLDVVGQVLGADPRVAEHAVDLQGAGYRARLR